jgi:hypothetical protein
MSIEGRGRRALASERALASDLFGGVAALQLFMINFDMEIPGTAPLLFCWKPNIQKNLNGAAPFPSTPQPNTPKIGFMLYLHFLVAALHLKLFMSFFRSRIHFASKLIFVHPNFSFLHVTPTRNTQAQSKSEIGMKRGRGGRGAEPNSKHTAAEQSAKPRR